MQQEGAREIAPRVLQHHWQVSHHALQTHFTHCHTSGVTWLGLYHGREWAPCPAAACSSSDLPQVSVKPSQHSSYEPGLTSCSQTSLADTRRPPISCPRFTKPLENPVPFCMGTCPGQDQDPFPQASALCSPPFSTPFEMGATVFPLLTCAPAQTPCPLGLDPSCSPLRLTPCISAQLPATRPLAWSLQDICRSIQVGGGQGLFYW